VASGASRLIRLQDGRLQSDSAELVR
jgi:hypothetical protein